MRLETDTTIPVTLIENTENNQPAANSQPGVEAVKRSCCKCRKKTGHFCSCVILILRFLVFLALLQITGNDTIAVIMSTRKRKTPTATAASKRIPAPSLAAGMVVSVLPLSLQLSP